MKANKRSVNIDPEDISKLALNCSDEVKNIFHNYLFHNPSLKDMPPEMQVAFVIESCALIAHMQIDSVYAGLGQNKERRDDGCDAFIGRFLYFKNSNGYRELLKFIQKTGIRKQ